MVRRVSPDGPTCSHRPWIAVRLWPPRPRRADLQSGTLGQSEAGFRHPPLKMEARIRALEGGGRQPIPATIDAHLRWLGRGRDPPFLEWTCTVDDPGALTLATYWGDAALAAARRCTSPRRSRLQGYGGGDCCGLRGPGLLGDWLSADEGTPTRGVCANVSFPLDGGRTRMSGCMRHLAFWRALGVVPPPRNAGGRVLQKPGRPPEDARRPRVGRGPAGPGRRARPRVCVTARCPETVPLFEPFDLATYHAALTR